MDVTPLRNAAVLLLWFGTGVAQRRGSVPIPPPDAKTSCRSLQGMTVPAAAIGLPTTGAYVQSAKLVHDRRGEYCKVLGGIRPWIRPLRTFALK